MGKFEFKDRSISVEICGKQYTLETSEKNAETVQSLAAEFPKLDSEDKAAQIEKLVEIIDTILGTGATKSVFSDRMLNVPDLVDLVEFLTAEINGANKQGSTAAGKRSPAKPKK